MQTVKLCFQQVNIDGQQIKKSDDVDLLGFNKDSKLSFDKHISSICSKVNK